MLTTLAPNTVLVVVRPAQQSNSAGNPLLASKYLKPDFPLIIGNKSMLFQAHSLLLQRLHSSGDAHGHLEQAVDGDLDVGSPTGTLHPLREQNCCRLVNSFLDRYRKRWAVLALTSSTVKTPGQRIKTNGVGLVTHC